MIILFSLKEYGMTRHNDKNHNMYKGPKDVLHFYINLNNKFEKYQSLEEIYLNEINTVFLYEI